MSDYTPALDVIRERAIRGGRVLDECAGAPATTARVYGQEFDRAISATRTAAIREVIDWFESQPVRNATTRARDHFAVPAVDHTEEA